MTLGNRRHGPGGAPLRVVVRLLLPAGELWPWQAGEANSRSCAGTSRQSQVLAGVRGARVVRRMDVGNAVYHEQASSKGAFPTHGHLPAGLVPTRLWSRTTASPREVIPSDPQSCSIPIRDRTRSRLNTPARAGRQPDQDSKATVLSSEPLWDRKGKVIHAAVDRLGAAQRVAAGAGEPTDASDQDDAREVPRS